MTPEGWIGPAIVAAFIAAIVTALGWVVTGRQERLADARRRVERVRDVQTALAAEILPYVEVLELFDLTQHLDDMIDRMRADESYRPVVPTERNDTVFRAILSDIHILPEPVIRPVVRYYSQLFAIEAIIEDLRADVFRTMSLSQREAIYADYISLKIQALALGLTALTEIEASLGRTPG